MLGGEITLAEKLKFRPGVGSIVGSFIPIEYGDTIKSIKATLSCATSDNTGISDVGRHVTGAVWIVDSNFFNSNDGLKLDIKNAYFCKSISNNNDAIINNHPYINTNTIGADNSTEFIFNFDNLSNVESTKLFFAFISSPIENDDNGVNYQYDFDRASLSVPVSTGLGQVYYRPNGGIEATNNTLLIMNNFNLMASINSVTHVSNDSNQTRPSKIQCEFLGYRTASAPDGDLTDDDNGWTVDGGETYLDAKNAHKDIHNYNENFNDKYKIGEYRLKDVEFANPELGSYSSDDIVHEPRWVFKRSQIKFIIKPDENTKIKKEIKLRYKIETAIYDTSYPSSEKSVYKYKTYDSNKENITLVICPRDEGVLDNSEFRVTLERCYVGNEVYSEPAVYYFHTYQKPIVNLAYPKTWPDETYCKILTSNLYSAFNGEESYRSKYVCDALTLLFATPKSDNSGIPMFIRYYIAEYKYGRNGCLNNDNTDIDLNKYENLQSLFTNNDFGYASIDGILNGESDTIKPTAYLTGIKVNDGQPVLLSGRLTNGNINTLKTINDKNNECNLWIRRDWDTVCNGIEIENNINTDIDILVPNPYYEIRNEKYQDLDKSLDGTSNGLKETKYLIRYNEANIETTFDSNPISPIDDKYNTLYISKTKPIAKNNNVIPDHYINYYNVNTNKTIEEPSSILLFRAGYIYLIKARMFHGAAAGAIEQYGGNDYGKASTIIGYNNTGKYMYASSDISFPNRTLIDHINDNYFNQFYKDKPYGNWIGPDDGTSHLSLNNSNINKTYPGFSQVDYTFVKPICPYVSKNNIVLPHPTSPQIGVNQWLTFAYRHLSKNIGDIDQYVYDDINNKYIGPGFGKTKGGIDNTITRIAKMYTLCARTILEKYMTSDKTKIYNLPSDSKGWNVESVNKNIITLYIEPIENDSNINEFYKLTSSLKVKCISDIDYTDSYDYTVNEGYDDNTNIGYYYIGNLDDDENIVKYHRNSFNEYIYNPPIINNFIIADSNNEELNWDNMNGYEYYLHKKKSDDRHKNFLYYSVKPNANKPNESNKPNINYGESICYAYNQYYDRSSFYSFNNHIYNYTWPETGIIYVTPVDNNLFDSITTSTIDPLGNSYRWQVVINAQNYKGDKLAIPTSNDNINTNGTIFDTNLNIRCDLDDKSFSQPLYKSCIQTKYYYNDQYKMFNSEHDFTNNEYKRFTINEFAGYTTGGDESYSGWPATYTTNVTEGYKYFSFNSMIDENNTYGYLFKRVPTSHDCENGYNKNNTSIRTTHYLFFKTYINTRFVLKADVDIKFKCGGHEVEDDDGGTHIEYDYEYAQGIYYFNGIDKMIKDTKQVINFGQQTLTNGNTIKGISAVYGEDNNGWGRCLSADDINSSKELNLSNETFEVTDSGGIEVPLMVRYTPLLQPQLASETVTISENNYECLNSNNKNISIKYYRKKKTAIDDMCNQLCIKIVDTWDEVTPVIKFIDSSNTSDSNLQELKSYNLNIYYPLISESGTIYTKRPNGGNSNLIYDTYNIDNDSIYGNSIDILRHLEANGNDDKTTNLDFFGGYGICTSYTVLLVPSDPSNKDILLKDGHLDYFKQRPNYYSDKDIYNIRSKSVPEAGPVLVAYCYNDKEFINSLNYCSDYTTNSSSFILNNEFENNNDKYGRCKVSLKFNIGNLLNGVIMTKSGDEPPNEFNLRHNNHLKVGLKYDLIIIPVYDNICTSSYDYDNVYCGTINGAPYGGGKTNSRTHFTGSNPLVIYNYLQVSNITMDNGIIDTDTNDYPTYIEDYESNITECSNCNILDTDHAIIFPNVDNKLFNVDSGIIKECPGFWLNNSFKLVLRLTSFRTENTKLGDADLVTIENLSNGQLHAKPNGTNTADDFEFEDIQIHIGKITELKDYGYPYEQDTNLNKITDKDELAKAHIISYKDYWDKGVFSKKLTDYEGDKRNKLTGGALNPKDNNYSHRFIEVNLGRVTIKNEHNNDVPIYTTYPEGFYIQFRWKSKYAAGNESSQWSDWHGGSYDGGKSWWGDKGLNYFVPVKNYSDIHTEFRQYIKESYPGSLIKNPENKNETTKLNYIVGQGSNSTYGKINESSETNPKLSTGPGYYYNGIGNSSNSQLVPTYLYNNKTTQNNNKTDNNKYHLYTNNHDGPHDYSNYKDKYNFNYKQTHDVNFIIPDNITNLSQPMWEMLYIDYIVRNMCKLYYKPNYNNTYTSQISGKNYTSCYLASPWSSNNNPLMLDYNCIGHDSDNTEIQPNYYKTDDNELKYLLYNEDKTNDNSINNERKHGTTPKNENYSGYYDTTDTANNMITVNLTKWNRNKYYRKIISRQDFDALNEHLQSLLTFLRDSLLCGNNSVENIDVIPFNPNNLNFNKSRKLLIGNSIDSTPGSSKINNINHTMMSSNYIQNIWQNILSIINCNDVYIKNKLNKDIEKIISGEHKINK